MDYDARARKKSVPLDEPVKVLIVDDEASQRSGLAAMVSAWGMTPETAGEGNEALQKLEEFAADVILTDLNMPGLDGFGFLQRLREAGDMPPTIVLTAYGNIETAVKTVHELGAYWFLEKPIQPSTLEVLIRRAGSTLPAWTAGSASPETSRLPTRAPFLPRFQCCHRQSKRWWVACRPLPAGAAGTRSHRGRACSSRS